MENFLVQEKLRSAIYSLLAQCYKIPEEALKEEKVVETLIELFSFINHEAASYAGEMIAELNATEDMEELKLDYLRLFAGPKTLLAPPYGSLYLEDKGQVMGVSTQHAMTLYEAAGLKAADDFKEPPDHIRVELEFLHYLIAKVIESCEEGHWDDAEKYVNLQTEFMTKHIGSWVKPFTQGINQNAACKFYKNLALATEAFIRQEATVHVLAMKEEFEEVKGN